MAENCVEALDNPYVRIEECGEIGELPRSKRMTLDQGAGTTLSLLWLVTFGEIAKKRMHENGTPPSP
jgi:hypothetical protein